MLSTISNIVQNNGDNGVDDTRTENRDNGNGKEQPRKRQQNIRGPHNDGIYFPAEIPGNSA